VRRVAALAGVTLGSLAVATPLAQASFHREQVSEVLLVSSSGDSSAQFVGLLDRGGTEEVFPSEFAPYKLVIYDAAANELGEQVLNAAGLRSAAAFGARYLISTAAADSALDAVGDERLRVPLPLIAGQACYQLHLSPSAFSCMSWGTITKPVPTNSEGSGSANGMTPRIGESAQLRPDNSVVAAVPFAGARILGRSAKVDRRGRALIRLRCPAATDGSCQGQLTLAPAHPGKALGRERFNIQASRTVSIQVNMSHSALTQLRQKRRLAARIKVVAHDAAGTSETISSPLILQSR
jgi:hypothetical protein